MNKRDELYDALEKADEVFTAAVIKQFGRKQSCDMRYHTAKFNADTRAAAEKYWSAAHVYLDAKAEVI
jgi:predicted lipase